MVYLPNLSLLLSALLSALIAGLFYGYSCSVNPGLGKLPDAEYLSAMQSINREILNPWFFASFMGTLVLLPLTAWLHYSTPAGTSFYLLAAAAGLYAIAAFGVTMVGNVPLNTALDAVDLGTATAGEISRHRASFEAAWNSYHQVRTLASVLSFILVVVAIFKK